MTAEQQQRLEFLVHGSCVPIEHISGYYGLTWPFVGDLANDFELWRNHSRRQGECAQGQAPRFLIESFMQEKRVTSKKWMAARLGMSEACFNGFVQRLQDLGLRPQRYVVYPDMTAESLAEDLAPALRGLRFRTFSDHNSFCERLHAALRDELGIHVEPLFCATSLNIQDYPRQYADNFDCITLEPLSGRHQVWLDFRKPTNLEPDSCSKLFYLENHDLLGPYRVATREPDLTAYEEFVGGPGHAG